MPVFSIDGCSAESCHLGVLLRRDELRVSAVSSWRSSPFLHILAVTGYFVFFVFISLCFLVTWHARS